MACHYQNQLKVEKKNKQHKTEPHFHKNIFGLYRLILLAVSAISIDISGLCKVILLGAKNTYISLDVLLCSIAEHFYELCLLYFDEPVGRYYTTKRLIRDLLSNTPSCYVRTGEFRR